MKTGVILFCLVLVTGNSFAETPAPTPAATPFHVNPDSIRDQLLIHSNLTLDQAFMRVQDAKTKVNLARTNLLPSLNLTALLGLSTGSTFILSGVQFLLPFLLPSNWFNLAQEKNLYSAEKLGFKALELNTLSSALSIYYTALNDQKMAAIYSAQASDYADLEQILISRDRLFQNISPSALSQAIAQAELSKSQAVGLKVLATQEISLLRQALNLGLETEMLIDDVNLAPVPEESATLEEVIQKSESIAPELEQVSYLVKAAKNARRRTIFGFLGGATLGDQVSPGSSTGVSASGARVTGSLSIGLSIFPSLQLSGRNVAEVQFQEKILKQQMSQVLEATLKSVADVKEQLALTSDAEAQLDRVVRVKQLQYELQTASLTDVLVARTQKVSASVAKAQAQLGLNLLRVTLNRSLISDHFAQVQGCLVISDERKQTLFDACREGGTPGIVAYQPEQSSDENDDSDDDNGGEN